MITKDVAQKVLREALKTGGDFAEIYVEDLTSLRLGLDDGRLEEAIRGADRGAGVRVFFGTMATYAYTDDLSEASLLKAAQAAAAAGTSNSQPQSIDLTEKKSPLQFDIVRPFDAMSIQDKAEILHRVDEAGRAYHSAIQQVSTSYAERNRRVWIYNSEGVFVQDDRTFCEFRAGVIASRDGQLQRAGQGFGGQIGLELFDDNDPVALIEDLAQSAVKMLDARPAPAGEMTVVLPNGWGGVLFHEACGHQMEADFITKGGSAYSGKVGEKVASSLITAIDDGTIPGRRGSMRFDDEGTPTNRTVLIEKGVLKEYMWDLTEARRVGRESSTGNGRRQSFRHMPMPRMTNTFIDAGEHDPQEIIENTKSGIYVTRMAGGQADIAKGDFVFNATEAYLIEDGKLTAPLKGATIQGHGPTVLSEIDMVGTDLALDPGMGMCGKGQWAHVSVGQPTVRIPKVMVGGTGE
jgi:TldD protein